MHRTTFKPNYLKLAAALAGLLLLAGCPPGAGPNREAADVDLPANTYMAAPNKVFDGQTPFDVTWNVVYESKEKPFDPAINVSNRQLALARCSRCHECAFPQAFDQEHYGTPQWSPHYKGQDWAPVVRRMADMQDSFMNEVIAERIYNYLKDDTEGNYDESKDPHGANTIAGGNANSAEARGSARTVEAPQR